MRAVARQAGIVDEHVDAAHRRLRRRHQLFDGRRIGEVAGHDMNAFLQLVRQSLKRFFTSAGERDNGTLMVQSARDRGTKTAAGTRDEGRSARKIKHERPLNFHTEKEG